jgi:VWFA-related protein
MRDLIRLSLGLLLAVALVATPAGQQPLPETRGSAAVARQQQGTPPPTTPPASQADGQQPQQPTFRAGVNFVRVDVIVTDKNGNPVKDLTPADFEVTEDGKPQKVETFKFVAVTGQPVEGEPAPKEIRNDYDEETEAARDDVRLFAILLDDYHVRRGASMAIQPPLINFIQKHVQPTDMVGLMFPLTPISALRMTRDRDSLISAIQKFQGRKFDYTPRNPIEEQYAMYPASVVERIRNEVTLSALRSLVVHMGSLREGRKAVILVSEGFTNLLPPALQDPISSMPGLGNPNRGSTAGVDDRARFFSEADMQRDLQEVYSHANRANTTIYTLDPRGLTAFEFDINEGIGLEGDRKMLDSSQDTLRILADQTDGRAIVNQNDFDRGLAQVVRDSSAYYLLGYSSTSRGNDGKFHEIKVRLKRPGLQVRARKGYWSLTAEEMERSTMVNSARNAVPPAVTKALGEVNARRDRYIRSWIGTAKGENGKTRVTFLWEALPPIPGVTRDKASKVTLIASGNGDRPYFRGPVVPGGDAASPQAAAAAQAAGGASAAPAPSAAAGRVTFEADPGALQLRLSIEGEGQVLDTYVQEVRATKPSPRPAASSAAPSGC